MGSGIIRQRKEVISIRINSNCENMNKPLNHLQEKLDKALPKTRCYKIKLACEDTPIFYNINLAGTSLYRDSFEYAIYFNYIKQMYNSFASARSYFATKVHEICLPDTNLVNGFKVLMISIHSNPLQNYSFLKDFPFISMQTVINQETREIFNSFHSFLQETEKILDKNSKKIKKCIQKMQNFLKDLQTCSATKKAQDLLRKNSKLCKQAIQVSDYLLRDASQTHEIFMNLFGSLEKDLKCFKELGLRAFALGLHSGEEIVHGVLLK